MDKKQIEGSPERASDRGRQEDLGFSVSAKPSLGNADVVRGIVSEFAGEVVSARKSYNQGRIDGGQAQERIRELAREYGRIIMGQDGRYDAMPWNDPGRLGRRIKLVVPAADGVDDPGELLFLTVGASLMSLAAAHEQGRVSDADGEKHTKVMLEDAANLILGLR